MIRIRDRLQGGVQSTEDSSIGELGNSRQPGSKLTDFNTFFALFVFQKVPHYVKQAHLKLMTVLLPQPPEVQACTIMPGTIVFSSFPTFFAFPMH